MFFIKKLKSTLRFTASFYRYGENQADGCNLCRNTIFAGDPRVLESYDKNGILVLFKRTSENTTKLQYFLPKTVERDEPNPEEVHEATPNGLMCMLVTCEWIYTISTDF